MAELMRHRLTKGSATDRPHLNHRATPRLHKVARSQCRPKSHIPRSLQSYVARLEFTYVTNLSMPVHLECQKDLSKLSVPLKYTTEYKTQAAKT
jgi:hypothetical protein